MKVTEPAGRFFQITYAVLNGQSVIDRVNTSDGRTIQYSYNVLNDGKTNWVALTGIRYGDGTKAVYVYTQSKPGNRPVLAQHLDPRISGNAGNMRYTYNPGAAEGFVSEERNGVTGDLMSTLTTNITSRTLCYPNGRTQVYLIPETRLGYVSNYTDGLGRQTGYTYHANNQGFPKTKTDAAGRVTHYSKLSDYGNPLEITYADGAKKQWTRDNLDLVLTQTDELGRLTTYSRDANHRITRIDYPDGFFETFTYNGFGQVLYHQKKNGAAEHLVYDSRGLLIRFTDALDNLTRFSYDNADRLATVTDARGNKTSYDFNRRGLLIRIINPDLSFRIFGYDAFGNRTLSINELSDTSSTTYDEFRRPINDKGPIGNGITYKYDLSGGICGCAHAMNRPTTITTASGRITNIAYDVEWEKINETTGAGTADAASAYYEYDLAGNLSTMVDPNGNLWNYSYDLRNRKTGSVDPLGNATKSAYDKVGNLVQTIRPDLGTILNKYDNMNRLVNSINPKSEVTRYKYDAEGNLIQLTDPKGNNYNFEFDVLNRNTKMTYPGGSSEIYSFDAVGNLSNYTNRSGNLRTYFYDNRNRDTLSKWNDNSTSAIAKTYDFAGRTIEMTSNESMITYVYDAAGLLIGEKQKVRELPSKQFNFHNNVDGLRDSLIYPDSTIINYKYSGRNQLLSVGVNGASPLVNYDYDPNGNRTGRALENSTKTNYGFDELNRTAMVDHKAQGSSFERFDYGYDNISRRTFVQRNKDKGDVFSYDAADQLTGVLYDAIDPDSVPANPLRSVSYQWDANGNRISVTDNGHTTFYTSNILNQYTAAGNDSLLKYDDNGNLKRCQGWTLLYDAQNRLKIAKDDSAGITVNFDYDALNRCVRRAVNGKPTYFFYDGWNLAEERDSTDKQMARYINGEHIDEMLKRNDTENPVYYYYDANGNATSLADTAGTVIEKYSFDVFGTPAIRNASGIIIPSSAFGNRFLFTGREYVQKPVLYDYRNRFYSPTLGRFLQTDPIGFKAGDVNLYRYVFNSPVNLSDPSGLCVQQVKIVVGALVAIATIVQTVIVVDDKIEKEQEEAKRKAEEEARRKAEEEATRVYPPPPVP